MEVSWNRGTPKSSILMVFSIINHPFGGTPISKKKTHSLGLPVGYILNCILISTDPTRHPGRNRPSTCHRCSWGIEYHYQRYASTAGKHAVAWQKNAGNHSRSAAVFIMLSVYIHIYIYISCTYINTYMYTSYFQTRPRCDVVWFGLIWMVLQRLDQARHWYLWFLAVKPHVQGEGLPGSCLRMWSIHSMGRWW